MTIDRSPLVEVPRILLEGPSGAGDRGSRYVLGVDGGATKTLAAVLDLDARSIQLGHAGPSNQDAVGVQAAGRALLDASGEAIERAGISSGALDAAVLAIAGTDTESVARHVHQQRDSEWMVVNDVLGAWATATGGGPGVGVISGTGSNVFGVGAGGRSWRAGGWGHILGDGGSGYWLSVQSIAAALSDRDGSGPQTALSDAVLDHFNVTSLEALASLVYSKPLTKSEIAAFAVVSGKLAEQGDPVARKLYTSAAQELGRLVGAVVRETGLEGSFPVGLIGSAFKAGGVFVQPLTQAICTIAPQAQVSVVEMAPVAGALMLALRACGAERVLSSESLQALIEAARGDSQS